MGNTMANQVSQASCIIKNIATLSNKDFQKEFELFYKNYKISNYLQEFEECFINKQNKLATAYLSLQQKQITDIEKYKLDNTKRTIGIFYHRYYNGGVERVISYQIQLVIKVGYNVVLFTEEINEKLEYPLPDTVIRVKLPISYLQNRKNVLLSAIEKYNIYIFCHHSTSSILLLFDLILLREAGVHTVITAHESTATFFAQNRIYPFDRITVYNLADILIVLSSCDEHFYQQCGVNAHYIPNQVTDIDNLDIKPIQQREKIVLWIGRLENIQKNYKEALLIFKNIIEKNDKITCYIVGSGNIEDNNYVNLFIKRHKLDKNIIHIPYTKNVDNFYKKASIHLVTSSFESFPMVIYEGKLYGLPLVTYDLPAIELLKNNKGCIRVERHNIQEATEAILKIIDNKEYLEQLSKEARESIEPFLYFNQENAWLDILNTPCRQYTKVAEKDAENMSLFWNELIFMYHEGLASRPFTKQIIKHIIAQIKHLMKTMLNPFFPPGSRRRRILIKFYYFIRNYLKIKYHDIVNYQSSRTK